MANFIVLAFFLFRDTYLHRVISLVRMYNYIRFQKKQQPIDFQFYSILRVRLNQPKRQRQTETRK